MTIYAKQVPPDSQEDINGFSVYCTGWTDDQIRQEIADAAGGLAANVKLYRFSGWTRHASWEEA